MAMLQRYSQSQRFQQRADPQLLLTNRILQMSSMELRQCVSLELDENPALESLDEHTCGHCDTPGLQCIDCPFGAFRRQSSLDGAESRAQAQLQAGREEDVDPLARVAAPPSLQEHLLTQLRAAGAAADLAAGRYLIDSIDEDGYLRCVLEDAARDLLLPLEEVERVLRLIQTFDPTGVGARTLQECLLIQARALAGERTSPPLVVRVISECWKELASSRLRDIARRLRVSETEAEQAVAWLRKNLSPYPGGAYRPIWLKSSDRDAQAVRPDVIVTLTEDGELVLEVRGGEAPQVQISPRYLNLWHDMRERPNAFTAAERKHVGDYITRAQMFLKSVQDRGSILRQVAERIVSEQERYLRTEREEDMLPLTQSQLASFLQVHESTVSRAVAEKFIQLPSGRVVPVGYFFDRALSHRKLVANVVASENPEAPYSDQEISDILRRAGVQIARRTVMKYREEMNILSSRRRARSAVRSESA